MDGHLLPPTGVRGLLAWLEVVVQRPVCDLRARLDRYHVCCSEVEARPHPGIDAVLIELKMLTL